MAHDIQKCLRTKDVLSNIDILFENDVLIEKEIRKGLLENGFIKESPIQMAAFPYVLNGYDAIVQSKSGTGKSIVFIVTALNKLVKLSSIQQPQTIILAPTREIAVQITDVIRTVGKHIPNLRVDYFIGGTPVERLARPVQIAVGSPGRIRQLIGLKHLSVDAVRLLVLDEADKLINRGFVDDITWIYSQLPSVKQMLVVSATYSPENLDTLSKYMVDPMFVRPEDASRPLLGVKQLVAMIPVESKNPNLRYVDEEKKLTQLLHHIPFTQCVIFSNYQLRPDVICERLAQCKLGAVFLSGAQEQSQRLASLDTFKRGQVRILVTTDLAARGIDAANVDLVVNLEVPHDAATYLHRMGRAGRYGTRGLVITIVNEQSLVKFHRLMAEINRDQEINVGMLPDKLGGEGGWLTGVEMLTRLDGEKEVDVAKIGGGEGVKVRDEEVEKVGKMVERDVEENEVDKDRKAGEEDVKTGGVEVEKDGEPGERDMKIGDENGKTVEKDVGKIDVDVHGESRDEDVKTGDEIEKDGRRDEKDDKDGKIGEKDVRTDEKDDKDGKIGEKDVRRDEKDDKDGKIGEKDVRRDEKDDTVGKIGEKDVRKDEKDDKDGKIGEKDVKTDEKDDKDGKIGEKDVKTDEKDDKDGKIGEKNKEIESHKDATIGICGDEIQKVAAETNDEGAEDKIVVGKIEGRKKSAKKTKKSVHVIKGGEKKDEKHQQKEVTEKGSPAGKVDKSKDVKESQAKRIVDKPEVVENSNEDSSTNTNVKERCAGTVETDNIKTTDEDLHGTSVTSATKLEPVDFDYLNEFVNSSRSKGLPNDSPNSTKFIGIPVDDEYLIRNMNACINNDNAQLRSLMEKLDHIDADTLADWIVNKHSNVAALFRNQDTVKDALTDGASDSQDKNTKKDVPRRELQSYDSLSMFSPGQTTLNKHDVEAEQPEETNKRNRRNRNRKNNKENKNILNTPTKTRKALNGNERTPDRANRNARNDPLRDDLNATNDDHLHNRSGNDSFLNGSRLPKRDLVVYDEIDMFSPAANNLADYEIDYINQDIDRKESSDDSLHHNDSLDIKLRKKLKAGGRLQRSNRRQSRQADANQSVVNVESSVGRSSADVACTPLMKTNGRGPTEQISQRPKSDARPSQSRKLSHEDTDFQISWEDGRSTSDSKDGSKSSINNTVSNVPESNSHSRPSARKSFGKSVTKDAFENEANGSLNRAYEANFSKLELSAYNDENSVFLPNSSSEGDTDPNEANRDDSETDSTDGGTNRRLGSVYNESSLDSSCIDLICDDLDEQYARDFSMHRDSQLYATPRGGTPRGTPKDAKKGAPRGKDELHFKSWIKEMELYNVSTNVNVSDDDEQNESYNMLKTPTPVKRRLPNRENPSDSVGRKAGGTRNPLLRRALVNKQNQVNMWNQENHGATYAPLEDPFVSNFSNSFNFETDFSNLPQWAKKSPTVRAMSHESHFRRNRAKHCAPPAQQLYASSPHHSRKHSNHAHKVRSMDHTIRRSNPHKVGSTRVQKCVHTIPTHASTFDPSRPSRKADSKKHRRSDNALLGADGDTVNATFGDYGDYTYSELNELEDYEFYETHPATPTVGDDEDEKDDFDSEENEDFREGDDLTDEDEENLLDNSDEIVPSGNSRAQRGSDNASPQSGSPLHSGHSSYKSISLESYSIVDCIDNPSLDVSWQSASSQIDNSTSGEIRFDGPRLNSSREKMSQKDLSHKKSHQSSRRNGQKHSDAKVVTSLKGGKTRQDGSQTNVFRAGRVNYNPYEAPMPGAWQSVPVEALETNYAPDETIYFSEETETSRDARGEPSRRFRPVAKSDAQARQKADHAVAVSLVLGQDRARAGRKHATRNINPEEHRRRRRNESFGNETFDIVDELEGLTNDRRSNKYRSGKNAKSSSTNHRSSQTKRGNHAKSRFNGNLSSSTHAYDLNSNSGYSEESYDEGEADCDVCCYENGPVNAPYECPYENVLRAHPLYYPGLDIARMRRGMERQRAFMEQYLTQMSLYLNVGRNVANTSCFDF